MKEKAPAGLDPAGRKLWRAIVDHYELRADELRVLQDACREADLVEKLDEATRGEMFDFLVKGSMGQQVINPLISELRQHRSTLAGLLRQLRLPDDPAGAGSGSRSAEMRDRANERWASQRGA